MEGFPFLGEDIREAVYDVNERVTIRIDLLYFRVAPSIGQAYVLLIPPQEAYHFSK
jgi:hypothetical protein